MMYSFHLKYLGVKIKDDETGRACGTYGEMRNTYRAFGGENLKKGTTWKTQEYMGRY
jgi:hypothetical protein